MKNYYHLQSLNKRENYAVLQNTFIFWARLYVICLLSVVVFFGSTVSVKANVNFNGSISGNLASGGLDTDRDGDYSDATWSLPSSKSFDSLEFPTLSEG